MGEVLANTTSQTQDFAERGIHSCGARIELKVGMNLGGQINDCVDYGASPEKALGGKFAKLRDRRHARRGKRKLCA
jgi:hypothetical protein